MKRAAWIVILVLLALLVGLWFWTTSSKEEALTEQRETFETERTELVEAARTWADDLVERAARSTFESFAAGIHADVLAGRTEALEVAKRQLLQLDTIASVHVLRVDGTVIISSDDKYTTAGVADDRANWALGVSAVEMREGTLPGTLELAAPIGSAPAPEAILWLGFNAERLRDATRPARLPELGGQRGESAAAHEREG